MHHFSRCIPVVLLGAVIAASIVTISMNAKAVRPEGTAAVAEWSNPEASEKDNPEWGMFLVLGTGMVCAAGCTVLFSR